MRRSVYLPTLSEQQIMQLDRDIQDFVRTARRFRLVSRWVVVQETADAKRRVAQYIADAIAQRYLNPQE